jgi:hypothetical protein
MIGLDIKENTASYFSAIFFLKRVLSWQMKLSVSGESELHRK